LGLGARAVTISSAAHQEVCVQLSAATQRRVLARLVCAALVMFCFSVASPAKISEDRATGFSSDSISTQYLFVATLNKETGEARFEEHPALSEQAQTEQQHLVIERIDFIGNRRIRSDTLKARTAYQDFFALWKDADPDIPVLKEAKAEYAKLQ